MTIEMLKGLPFSVDTWSPNSSRKRNHFLTHAHKDHTQAICTYASYPIYCTLLTKSLVLQHYPQLDRSVFVNIEVGQSLDIEDPDGRFTVTAFDANHCPGALMFLFEGNFGNILHTGDCRLTTECLQRLPEKYVGNRGRESRCPLDCVFLDCTFGKFPLRMPTRQSAIQQVINCIWKYPDAPTVYLTCDLLGQEEILVNVSRAFGCKIYVDKEKNPECSQALELLVPEILSQDPRSRFQLFGGFPGLYDRAEAKIAEARANFQHEPLIIRASSQWYAYDEGCSEMETRKKERFDQAVRDLSGVWHVCYSIHSSREELEWALQLLTPRWVVSTTPSCRAMELDYVKKHCFNRKHAMDDPFWKLLEIDMSASQGTELEEASVASDVPSFQVQTTSKSNIDLFTQPAVSPRRQLHVSPPMKRLPVTLFGRARQGIVDSAFTFEVNKGHINSGKTERNVFQKHVTKEDGKSDLEGFKGSKVAYTNHISVGKKIELDKVKESNAPNIIMEHQRNGSSTPNGSSENVAKEDKSHLEENRGSNVDTNHISVDSRIELNKFEECSLIDTVNEHQRTVSATSNGSSKSFSASLRKFYRSMNAPVPEPLPSLVELMNANKRARRWL
nr:5' exonuclease Apollo isoform X1 [Ipomoea batatas]